MVYQAEQNFQVIIFLSALTLLGTDQNTSIISAVKLLSPSRGTMDKVTESPKNSGLSCLYSQQSAAGQWAEVGKLQQGLLSRAGGQQEQLGNSCAHWHTLWGATPCASLCPCQPVPGLARGRGDRHPSWKGPALPPGRAGSSGGSLRARCSCEREVTSPGSAQQLQAAAMSEKCSCLYSCSLFQLPFVCRHVTADAPQQYNRYLDSFAAGTSKCNPANQTLCLSELS